MESKMLSLENISVVKCAVLTCLSSELKQEILCVRGSEYDRSKSRYLYYRKQHWIEIIERKTRAILNHRELPENLQDKVITILPAIALRMLIWAEYHEGTLGLTRCYSFNFLSYSHFTPHGLVDSKKAAEEMVKDVNLSIQQKYKLACIYCFTDHIHFLFKKIVGNKKKVWGPENTKWMEKPSIVRYWSFLKGVIDDGNKNNTQIYRCRVQQAIQSGSEEAVKYSWAKAGLLSREQTHEYAATEVLKNKKLEESDWIVFGDDRYDDSKDSWIPNDYYVDILCFFLSNMPELQQQKVLERSIKGLSYIAESRESKKSTVLDFFLRWPYQDYFMRTAVLLWDLMPEKTYARLLLKICDNIEPWKSKNLLYGEEKIYDYKNLLKEFWCQSPDNLKRYVFQNHRVSYTNGIEVETTTGIGLLLKLLSLKQFTYVDKEIIWLILGSATVEERKNLLSAKWWKCTCESLLKKEKFEIIDRMLLVFFKSEEERNMFKNMLELHKDAPDICMELLYYNKMNAVKSLIKWLSLSIEEQDTLKKIIIHSSSGRFLCKELLLSGRYKAFENLVQWFLPSPAAAYYKKTLPFHINFNTAVPPPFSLGSPLGTLLDLVNPFVRSNLPNREAIKEFKMSIAHSCGYRICKDLIVNYSINAVYDEKDSTVRVQTEFRGSQWGKLDHFLTWCLSTKQKVLEFKKTLFRRLGVEIHFKLIKAKQWEEAKRFFEWLGLSGEEIKDLKKRTLFDGGCWTMFHYLVFTEHDDDMDRWETADLILRWHLTDKDTVIEFRDTFFYNHEDSDEGKLKKFNSLIESYLGDLEQEESFQNCGDAEKLFFRLLEGGGLKRKTSAPSVQKKLRLSQAEKEVQQKEKNGTSCRRVSQRLLNRAKKS